MVGVGYTKNYQHFCQTYFQVVDMLAEEALEEVEVVEEVEEEEAAVQHLL